MIQLAQHCFWSYPQAARQVCNLWNWLWPLHWLHRIEDEYVRVCISGVIGETFSPDYRPPQMADFAIHTDMVLYVLKFVLTFIRSSRLSTSHLFDTDYTTFVMSTLLLRYWELYDIKYIINFGMRASFYAWEICQYKGKNSEPLESMLQLTWSARFSKEHSTKGSKEIWDEVYLMLCNEVNVL